MEVKRSIDIVDDTIACACQRWSTIEEVDHSLRQITVSLKQRVLRMGNTLRCGAYRLYEAFERAERKSCNLTIYEKNFLAIALSLSEQSL